MAQSQMIPICVYIEVVSRKRPFPPGLSCRAIVTRGDTVAPIAGPASVHVVYILHIHTIVHIVIIADESFEWLKGLFLLFSFYSWRALLSSFFPSFFSLSSYY